MQGTNSSLQYPPYRRYLTGLSLLALFFWGGCSDSEPPTNPFDDQTSNQDTVRLELTSAESSTIAGIYYNVFQPTCANVGCHDGTFEPDFRTLESAYNTLVYEVPIKNDGSYTYRVDPGSVETSVIMARLNNILSPPMPIQLEPDSDWFEYGDDYIEDIRTWIENGALDIMGQAPTVTDHPFKLEGIFAMQNDSIYRRFDSRDPLRLPSDSVADSYIYLALSHPDREVSDLQGNVRAGFSKELTPYDDSISYALEYLPTPYMYYGYQGETIPFHFRLAVRPDSFAREETYYIRLFIQNESQEIPSDEALFHIKKYYSIEWLQ